MLLFSSACEGAGERLGFRHYFPYLCFLVGVYGDFVVSNDFFESSELWGFFFPGFVRHLKLREENLSVCMYFLNVVVFRFILSRESFSTRVV